MKCRNIGKKKEKRYKKNKKKIDDFLIDATPIKSYRSKDARQNITDNDCRVVKDKKSYYEGYNGNISVDNKNGIIVANDLTNSSDDTNMFITMMENIEENMPENKKDKLKEIKFLNDAGYYSIDNILYSNKRELNVYMPDKQDKNIYLNENNRKEKRKRGKSTDCIIEKKDNVINIYCPEKELLVAKPRKSLDKRGYYCFKIKNRENCKKCKKYLDCIGKNKHKIFTVKKKLIDNWDIVKNMWIKLTKEENKLIYSKRMPLIEKIFGHIKNNLKYIRATVRSLEKVKTQWSIVCSAYNLKRLYNTYIKL